MKKTITLTVNGTARSAEVEARTTLLDMIRDQFGLTGACSFLAVDADGAEVLTVKALNSNGSLHPLQEAFMEFGALQCGYCTSGFILTAKALLDECPRPSEGQIRDYLAGNFCRCGCYQEIVQAIQKVARS